MTDVFDDEEEEYESTPPQSCVDPETRKPRLLSRQCSTCIFLPGNKMKVRQGRLMDMINEAIKDGSQGIICHQTLTYGEFPDFGAALCRGFYDSVGYKNQFVRIMERLGGFSEVEPPK